MRWLTDFLLKSGDCAGCRAPVGGVFRDGLNLIRFFADVVTTKMFLARYGVVRGHF